MIKPKTKVIYMEKGKDALFKTWHATDAVTVLFVHAGGGSIVCAERSYPFSAGTLCLIGRGRYHYTLPNDPSGYTRSKLFIPKELFERIFSLCRGGRLHQLKEKNFVYAPIPEAQRARVAEIFESVNACGEPYGDLAFASAVMQLLIALDRFSTADIQATEGTVSRAIEYINQNIAGEITVDGICENLHISKYYFCRKFKASTGMTMMNYVLKTRITLAKDMLADDETSITEVSIKCGFSSVSYFCRVFKEDTGITPRQFKSRARIGE